MDPSKKREIRVLRRLVEAEGYLELGMPSQALARLEGIDDSGPLLAVVEMLRGKALWVQHRFDDAAHSLRFAAQHIHAPFDRPAWLALSWYYHNRGETDRAIQSLARARGAHFPDPSSSR